MSIRSYPHHRRSAAKACGSPALGLGAGALGIAVSGAFSQIAHGDDAAVLPEVQVDSGEDEIGTNLLMPKIELYNAPIQDIPQAIDVISNEQLQEQSITRLQDALRNVPGITMNSGEGGAHGDNINLRGLVVQNGFFMDGMRDPGSYSRDSFNLESVDVIKGPSSLMFGYGSTAGIVNQETKLPEKTSFNNVVVKGGTNDLARVTGDFNHAFDADNALRLAVMAERSNVADRDVVLNRRFGFAPSVSFGMAGPTRLTLSYLHQEENNIPDYGIPFLWGAVAPAARQNFYGLANYDRTQTDTNVLTMKFEHDFSSALKLTNTFRWGNYGFNYQVTAPTLTNDYSYEPSPGTPLDNIDVYRDQPSSAGHTNLFSNRCNLAANFATGSIKHDVVTGFGLSRESMSTTRYVNQINAIAPTSLLNPNPYQVISVPSLVSALPGSTGDNINLYAVDTVHVTDQWDLIGGLNFDRFISRFYSTGFNYNAAETRLLGRSYAAYTETNNLVSPRAAMVFKPADWQNYYFSYGTSYNPAIQYLTLAPSSTALSPQKTTNLELGAKYSLLGGRLSLNGALFQIQAANVRVADPDDPTLQAVSFSERVKGVELTLNGRLSEHWEINTGYTHLQALISQGVTISGANESGNQAPNVPGNTFNLWTTYAPATEWKLGSGLYFYGKRYASTDNSTSMPSYMLWNLMATYQFNSHVNVQLNLDNVLNKYYFMSAYYSSSSESHAIPGPGRTGLMTISLSF